MMQRIQSLFDRLSGIAHFEAERIALAHAIFAETERHFEHLEKPAYLRRRSALLLLTELTVPDRRAREDPNGNHRLRFDQGPFTPWISLPKAIPL